MFRVKHHHHRVSAWTGLPGFGTLWLNEKVSVICCCYLSVAGRESADRLVRYTVRAAETSRSAAAISVWQEEKVQICW